MKPYLSLSAGMVLFARLAAVGAEPPGWSDTIIANQEKFRGESAVVLLYDPEAGRTLHATPGAEVVRFELSSLLKPVVIDEAVKRKAVAWDTIIDCGNGRLELDGRTVRDVRPLRKRPVADVMAEKSNIGCCAIARQVRLPALDARLQRFGIAGGGLLQYGTGKMIVATPEQTVRLYAALGAETKSRIAPCYTATARLAGSAGMQPVFPCAIGFVKPGGKELLLFVGLVNPHPVSAAATVAAPFWSELAATLGHRDP